MDRDQLGSVGVRPFDLDHRHEMRDAGHDVVSGQQRPSAGDEISNRAPLAGAFQNFVDYVGNRFGMVERQTLRPCLRASSAAT